MRTGDGRKKISTKKTIKKKDEPFSNVLCLTGLAVLHKKYILKLSSLQRSRLKVAVQIVNGVLSKLQQRTQFVLSSSFSFIESIFKHKIGRNEETI